MSKTDSKTKKSTKLQIRQRRVFSDEFKRAKVAELTSGQTTIANFSKLWGISINAVYKWIYKYSPQHQKGSVMVVQLESEASKTEVLMRRISELERALGQKQMIIDYQDKLIEVASEELDIDLKKSFAHKP